MGDQRQGRGCLGCAAHQVLQIGLGQDEQGRPDHRAIHRAHAADHDHQEDVEHDLEAERGVRPDIAQPDGKETPCKRCNGRGQAGCNSPVPHHTVADRLGPEIILSDRLQYTAKGRIHETQQNEEQDERGGKHQIVIQDLAADPCAHEFAHAVGRGQNPRDLVGQPVFTAGYGRELRNKNSNG